jgi:hypothetical protein
MCNFGSRNNYIKFTNEYKDNLSALFYTIDGTHNAINSDVAAQTAQFQRKTDIFLVQRKDLQQRKPCNKSRRIFVENAIVEYKPRQS